MPDHVGKKHKTWILLQKLNKQVQDLDDVPAEWETVYTIRASVLPASSSEPIEGQKKKSRTTHDVEFRWMPDVDEKFRVVIEDGSKATDAEKRILQIDSLVNWKERNQYLIAECYETKG